MSHSHPSSDELLSIEPNRIDWQFPFYRLFRGTRAATYVLRSFWIILPLEFWISGRIGAISSEGLIAALALVFYKALIFVALPWLVISAMSISTNTKTSEEKREEGRVW